MIPSRISPVVAALLVLPLLQGCVAAVAAVALTVGYVQYDRNEYEEELSLPFDATWQGAQRAVHSLGFQEGVVETVEPTQSVLEVEDLWVRVEKLPFGKSKLRVRVGTFASKDHARRTRLVVEEVHRTLGLEPPVFEVEEEPQGAPAEEPATVEEHAPAAPPQVQPTSFESPRAH